MLNKIAVRIFVPLLTGDVVNELENLHATKLEEGQRQDINGCVCVRAKKKKGKASKVSLGKQS
jgi:hypothetical protein